MNLAALTLVKKLLTLHDRSRGLYPFLDESGEIVRSNSDLYGMLRKASESLLAKVASCLHPESYFLAAISTAPDS
ncbi:MAG: hypothetical protein JGK17_19850 [Microcoleus sp. PH2017_10_PVI_O_A]|uniref:hypothetical protein n=1 Tax=unclassified Microcoleus TaxID=2642155 RepID=UPI001D587B16|nr:MULTISPECIES: hypothetical protein [unclassified Microcoleus]TAE80014.1 MAG: hypothetical protein EAZ83_19590 [Oscillatoriales cyanobacterium]MCC3407804.1 hypothetical protein [Microcoleus sp. PH2017_10_PVI_O_A]MCC3461964.1 hypothetical protein [Microcoleus sp. PH2017_11_PCY_U_A]MCC3480424.1 hypothetical protein [Microcoleus sp. PH2017_12_PCY_D_A]MCC3530218.1 hypothetical protein [Microcoleus sp. PH2017_21_RUC_O_A]